MFAQVCNGAQLSVSEDTLRTWPYFYLGDPIPYPQAEYGVLRDFKSGGVLEYSTALSCRAFRKCGVN